MQEVCVMDLNELIEAAATAWGWPKNQVRGEMEQYLRERAFDDAVREITERLARADAQGTSEIGGEPRDATSWDEEQCRVCDRLHHAFSEGRCCDDGADHPRHGPHCAPTGGR